MSTYTPDPSIPQINETAIPGTDPYQGNYVTDISPSDAYLIALEEDFWLSFPPRVQALHGMAPGPGTTPRQAAYESAKGAGLLGKINDPVIFVFGQGVYMTVHNRQMYRDLAGIQFPAGWVMDTDRQDYKRWQPPAPTPEAPSTSTILGQALGGYGVPSRSTGKVMLVANYGILPGDSTPPFGVAFDPPSGQAFLKFETAGILGIGETEFWMLASAYFQAIQ